MSRNSLIHNSGDASSVTELQVHVNSTEARKRKKKVGQNKSRINEGFFPPCCVPLHELSIFLNVKGAKNAGTVG